MDFTGSPVEISPQVAMGASASPSLYLQILCFQWFARVAQRFVQSGQSRERRGPAAFLDHFSSGFSTEAVESCVLPLPVMGRERILVIEDEPDIAEVLQYNLEKEGFD